MLVIYALCPLCVFHMEDITIEGKMLLDVYVVCFIYVGLPLCRMNTFTYD